MNSRQPFVMTADEMEDRLTQFEQDRRTGPVDLMNYAPPADADSFNTVITELARIDLEYAYDAGDLALASLYIDAFPAVFADPCHRTPLAFEEYRLRRRHGDDVSANEIANQYDVDGSGWPRVQLGPEMANASFVRHRSAENSFMGLSVHYPSVGETIAGYPLVERLGEGAYSRVFLARQPDLVSRLVVLKVTPLSTEESDQLALLQHTNIVPIYSVHRERDLSCICMPFLGATTLADLSLYSDRWSSLDGPAEELVSTILNRSHSTIHLVTDQDRPLSERIPGSEERQGGFSDERAGQCDGLVNLSRLGYIDAFLTLIHGAVEGLAHAHQRGIVHRDLKPANLLVTDDGRSILLDFNLAVASTDEENRLVGGTLPYMSPQQLESIETHSPADSRDDIFSMGVILFELLSGKLPYPCPGNGEQLELRQQIAGRRKKAPSLRSINAMVSPGLESIINRCLASERDWRYRDADELLEDLDRHRSQMPLRHAPNVSWNELASKWMTRHPRLTSGSTVASAAIVILIMACLMIWQRGQRIARMRVEAKSQQLESAFPSVVMSLSTPGREPDVLQDGLIRSSALMSQWNVGATAWDANTDATRLTISQRDTVAKRLSRLAYLMAAAEADKALQIPTDAVNGDQAALRWNQLAIELNPLIQPLAENQRRRIAAMQGGTEKFLQTTRLTKSAAPELQLIAAAESGDVSRLRQLCLNQLESHPNDVIAWFNLSIADWRLGNLDDAVAGFSLCDRIHPRGFVTIFNRGLCNLERQQPKEAIKDFSECLKLKPQSVAARFNRAVAARRMGDFESALKDLDVVVASESVTTRMVLLRSQVHDALGNRRESLADRRYAMQIKPRDANDWVARGVSQLNESPKLALKDFETARQIDPDHFPALQNIAHVYAERMKQPEQAVEILNRLVALRPQAASPVASRGILHARLGQADAAIQDARSAESLSPSGLEQLQIAGIYALIADDLTATNELSKTASLNRSILWLARAIRLNSKLAKTAANDDDLMDLQEDPTFQRLVRSGMLIDSVSK